MMLSSVENEQADTPPRPHPQAREVRGQCRYSDMLRRGVGPTPKAPTLPWQEPGPWPRAGGKVRGSMPMPRKAVPHSSLWTAPSWSNRTQENWISQRSHAVLQLRLSESDASRRIVLTPSKGWTKDWWGEEGKVKHRAIMGIAGRYPIWSQLHPQSMVPREPPLVTSSAASGQIPSTELHPDLLSTPSKAGLQNQGIRTAQDVKPCYSSVSQSICCGSQWDRQRSSLVRWLWETLCSRGDPNSWSLLKPTPLAMEFQCLPKAGRWPARPLACGLIHAHRPEGSRGLQWAGTLLSWASATITRTCPRRLQEGGIQVGQSRSAVSIPTRTNSDGPLTSHHQPRGCPANPRKIWDTWTRNMYHCRPLRFSSTVEAKENWYDPAC